MCLAALTRLCASPLSPTVLASAEAKLAEKESTIGSLILQLQSAQKESSALAEGSPPHPDLVLALESKEDKIDELSAVVQSLREQLASAKAKPAPQRLAGAGDVPLDVLGPYDAAPPVGDSLYKRVHGVEPWQQPGLKLLALHNMPSDDWVANASAAVAQCDLAATFPYDTEEITLVSVLLDLGRGNAESGEYEPSQMRCVVRGL